MKINLIRTYEDKVHEMSRQYILKSKRFRIKQKDIAEMLGVTSGAISRQFTQMRLTSDTMAAIELMAEERRDIEKE